MTSAMQTALAAYIASDILNDPGYGLTSDEALISSGLIDSFSLVDLSLFVEEQYGVKIEDHELTADSFDTLAQLEALIQSRQ